MRQPTAFAMIALLGLLLLTGCSTSKPGGSIVSPVPGSRYVQVAAPKGNPTTGKSVFQANGCGACHTFKAAGSTGKVGPDLDKLPQYAKQANRGSLDAFVQESIQSPNAYIQPGYPANVMPTFSSLSAHQVADLVAFLTLAH